MDEKPAIRRRFQFSLRTLMIGVTMLAVLSAAVTWAVRDRLRLVRDRDEARELLHHYREESNALLNALSREQARPVSEQVRLDKADINELQRRVSTLETTLSQRQSADSPHP